MPSAMHERTIYIIFNIKIYVKYQHPVNTLTFWSMAIRAVYNLGLFYVLILLLARDDASHCRCSTLYSPAATRRSLATLGFSRAWACMEHAYVLNVLVSDYVLSYDTCTYIIVHAIWHYAHAHMPGHAKPPHAHAQNEPPVIYSQKHPTKILANLISRTAWSHLFVFIDPPKKKYYVYIKTLLSPSLGGKNV